MRTLARVKFPRLDVCDRLARLQSAKRRKRFQLDKALVAIHFDVAAHVGVQLIGARLESLDEQDALSKVSDPAVVIHIACFERLR